MDDNICDNVMIQSVSRITSSGELRSVLYANSGVRSSDEGGSQIPCFDGEESVGRGVGFGQCALSLVVNRYWRFPFIYVARGTTTIIFYGLRRPEADSGVRAPPP